MDLPAVAAESGESLLTAEDEAGRAVSGEVEVAGCFSSGLSIFGCLVFIARPSRRAPDAFCRSGPRSARLLGLPSSSEIRQTPPFVARRCWIFIERRGGSWNWGAVDYSSPSA